MFVFRVKHLLLACLLISVFLYFTSNSRINDVSSKYQTGIGEPKYDDLPNRSDDAERFIDKYIEEESHIRIKEIPVTTEEIILYINSNESEELTEEEEDEDEEVIETASEEYNEEPTDETDSTDGTVSSMKEDDFSVKLSKLKEVSHPKKLGKPSGPLYPKVINGKRNTTKTGRLGSKEFLPKAPSINKERQNQIHKQSPIVVLPRDSYWPPVMQPSDARIFSQIDYTKYNAEDRELLAERVGLYEERARTVSEVCREHPELITATPVHNFVWDQRHDPNIVWCEIPKAASTSWMVNFLRLGHYRENDTSLAHLSQNEQDAIRFETKLKDDNLHFRVLRLFPAPNTTRERYEVFSNALRFIIVRHPFTRLLSAYMDKMTTLNPLPIIYKFRELQTDIIERYRGNRTLPSNHDSNFPTFGEFVQYVIDSTAHMKTLKDWKKVICWQPYWTKCGVCAHDFQMVMKTETMEEDERFLVKLANLKELDKVYEWRHSKKSDTNRDEFFRQLSTEQVRSLYERYHLDFLLFGYSIQEYLELAYDASENNK
ncbi:carbohydrate sulfotransferase 11-like [Palaemon carinicauda]|uniref:carbohydrate sulfotransferase 11-like n=1 Tax=Palaemon carinicauda TaxID=392227 RepID=UPI0035B64C6A